MVSESRGVSLYHPRVFPTRVRRELAFENQIELYYQQFISFGLCSALPQPLDYPNPHVFSLSLLREITLINSSIILVQMLDPSRPGIHARFIGGT